MTAPEEELTDVGEITGRLPEDPWNDLYERLVLAATDQGRATDLPAAREEYFRRTGEAHADDPDYVLRMNLFLDWYVFHRKQPDGVTPAERVFAGGDHPELAVLAGQRHALFEFRGVKGVLLKLKDLVARERIRVHPGALVPFFTKGDVFEARVVPGEGGELHLFGPICQHPGPAAKPVRKFLRGVLKETKRDPLERGRRVEGLLLALRRLRERSRRYAHVSPARIYSEGLEKYAGEGDATDPLFGGS